MTNNMQPLPSAGGPLFVGGVWRSGTSLLYTLLNQHPQIALMYESDLPLLAPMFWKPRCDWAARWEFWNSGLSRHRLDACRLLTPQSDVKGALESAGREYARKKNASIWGCKSPNYFDSLSTLAKDFPEARFVVIWRDPADVCRSILEAASRPGWFARPGMTHRALFGYRELKRECDLLQSTGAALLQLQYEELIRDTRDTMARVCTFLQIPFDERMASPAFADRSAIYPGEQHILVKGTTIVHSRPRPEFLTQELRKKIERYVCLWREQSGGAWPSHSGADQCGCERPRPWEMAWDHVSYKFLRTLDKVAPLAFSVTPLRLWNAYRAFKRHYLGSPASTSDGALV